MPSNPNEWGSIFDSLKPGMIIRVAYTSVMGGGRYADGKLHDWKVGRRSHSKRYGTTSIRLDPVTGPKSRAGAVVKLNRRGNGTITSSIGDMGTFLKDLRIKGGNSARRGGRSNKGIKWAIGHWTVKVTYRDGRKNYEKRLKGAEYTIHAFNEHGRKAGYAVTTEYDGQSRGEWMSYKNYVNAHGNVGQIPDKFFRSPQSAAKAARLHYEKLTAKSK